MVRAAEPSDVYWENMHVKTIQRVKTTCFTYFITAIVLIISFLINFLLGLLKRYLEDDAKDSNDTSLVLYLLIGIITSINS